MTETRVRKIRPPMPAEGGSYSRQADGALELVERTALPEPGSVAATAAEPLEAAPQDPPAGKSARRVKEG
ncbi:hypothetical protein [Mesorhizobium australicum]|uniref:Uncharacterized protein n=1 Tax=Mesorhizobium australicum TaxID=536018 RepID=A0A1X7NX66_9HYPH|nr:hypothetical protein [Mesorhizobium australicum]SMH42500.1 hypothetical protein SAMN02982922_2750 [Mesorhizobium australicum]